MSDNEFDAKGSTIYVQFKPGKTDATFGGGFLIEVPPGAKFTINKGKRGELDLVPEPNTPPPVIKIIPSLMENMGKLPKDLLIYDFSNTPGGKPAEAIQISGVSKDKMHVTESGKDGGTTVRYNGVDEMLAEALAITPAPATGNKPTGFKPK